MKKIMNEINKNFLKKDKLLSKYATKNINAISLKKETHPDFRTLYFKDIDRIIHSLSFTRYIDKTQVYSLKDNDNISKRIIHVTLVSKIARTIGRALNLNEDLIEAASLGHDLGHTPFGHVGESILNELSLKYNNTYFNHNIQSVRDLLYVENNGKGLNITLQTLDAIMCHNGEILNECYHPGLKNEKEFINEYNNAINNNVNNLIPMTLEGCVVRISDLIAYLGRDIEDAVRLGLLDKSIIPKEISQVLGETNSSIINTIVNDILKNSYKKPYITISKEVFNAMLSLKEFNYNNIYKIANTKNDINFYKLMFSTVFNKCLHDLEQQNKKSEIYEVFLNNMDKEYLEKWNNVEKVIDFIAGMTDDYILKIYNSNK